MLHLGRHWRAEVGAHVCLKEVAAELECSLQHEPVVQFTLDEAIISGDAESPMVMPQYRSTTKEQESLDLGSTDTQVCCSDKRQLQKPFAI